MTQEGRRPFTADDKDHLAQFLIGIPLDKREAPSTHKEMERRHPEHSHQAWLNHYKKVDKDGIERRIERIRRQRERDKDPARSAKGKQRARDDDDLPDDDDNDNDDVQVKKPRPSTSRPTATDDAPPPTKNKKKKRKALELPHPSSSSSSDEGLVKARKRRAGCKKKYTAEDFKQLVRIMYRAEQESWLKQRIYTALEAYDPDHSARSWQTYHRDNRDSAAASLVEYRKLKKGAKKTKKRRKREATTESAASSVFPPPHKKQKQRPEEIELSDDDDDDTPGPSTSARPRPPPVASTSKAAQPAASTSASTTAAAAAASTSTSAAPARAPRASLPAIPTSSAPAKVPRPSLPAPRTAPLAPAPASTTGKGKQRAVDPDELPAASAGVVAAPAPPRAGSVEHAAEVPIEADLAAPFDEQDTAELVHQLARAELKGWTKDTVWKFMAKKLGRSPDDWRAFYVANVVDLLLQVARKVGEILAAQQRKREAAAAAAAQQEKDEAERLERERAEAAVAAVAAAVAAAEAERLQREKEREESQRRAREAEEQREREEQARLDAEEEARQRAAAEAAELEREEKERAERAKVEKARAEQLRAARLERDRARRKEGPSTSPPPFSSQGAQPVAAKPTSLGQPAASTVLTPRSTPPLRTAAAAPLFLPSSPTTRASIEAMYGADLDAIDEDDALPVPDASGSSLPHLSQYSVAPSPFLDAQQLVGTREQRDDDDELGSKADTDDRELDAQFSAAVAASIKVERDDDDALALEQHVGDDEDDDAPIWDPLLDVEYHLIIDSHELVEALSARAAAAAAAPPLDAGPSAAVERPTPSSKKRRRTESPARAAADELEPQQQPASKRQRVVVVDKPPAPAPVVEQPAPAHEPAATAASAAPPLRSSPAVSRRVPRASLAAVAGSSPAPPPLPTPRLAASIAAPAPVPAPSPVQGPAPAPTPSARRPLKEELADVSASSGLSYMAVRDLYFCVSALSDMSILSDVAAFFSPAAAGRRPREGTAEWDRARRRVDKYVWSAREDEVVLEGTEEARARVDERKGAGSVERRREFLRRAKMTKIADLRASLYARKA